MEGSTLSPYANKAAANDIDKKLAKELNEMSFNDRNILQEEIHCVNSTTIEETPQSLESSLQMLQQEIDALAPNQRVAYDDVLITASHYVKSADFCLKFLRTELFDAKKAALRLTAHVDHLLKAFGPEALTRPLRYTDLSKMEQEHMKTGAYQILPSRDRAGRLIAFFTSSTKGLNNFHRVSCL
jgi:hypothetical protein